MKSILYYIIIFVLFISCQTKKMGQDLDIIETKPFSKEFFYRYEYPRYVNYYIDNNSQKLDSFRPIIYTIVEPLDENKKIPKKINALYFDSKKWKKSIEYFESTLKGKNLSYLEKDNKIVVRNFYIDYAFNKGNNYPVNIKELENLLKSKKVIYKILNQKKDDSYYTVDLIINSYFYRIIFNSHHCTSYLFYDKKDTIYFKGFSNILINYFQ